MFYRARQIFLVKSFEIRPVGRQIMESAATKFYVELGKIIARLIHYAPAARPKKKRTRVQYLYTGKIGADQQHGRMDPIGCFALASNDPSPLAIFARVRPLLLFESMTGEKTHKKHKPCTK